MGKKPPAVNNNQREKSLELISLELIHTIKNTLLSTQTSLTALNKQLPELIQTYQIARSHKLNIGDISSKNLDTLQPVIKDAKQEIKKADFMLNLFTFMAQEDQWIANNKSPVSIKSVWTSAIAHCPLMNEKIKSKANNTLFNDFIISTNSLLLEKIFLLLLYNICKRIDNDNIWKLSSKHEGCKGGIVFP